MVYFLFAALYFILAIGNSSLVENAMESLDEAVDVLLMVGADDCASVVKEARNFKPTVNLICKNDQQKENELNLPFHGMVLNLMRCCINIGATMKVL
jgi:hypothetical protein